MGSREGLCSIYLEALFRSSDNVVCTRVSISSQCLHMVLAGAHYTSNARGLIQLSSQ